MISVCSETPLPGRLSLRSALGPEASTTPSLIRRTLEGRGVGPLSLATGKTLTMGRQRCSGWRRSGCPRSGWRESGSLPAGSPPSGWAPVRFAPVRLAPLRLAPLKLSPLRLRPERSQGLHFKPAPITAIVAVTGFGCQPTDQRGVPRPQGSACDAGAYELDTTPLRVMITAGPSGTVTTPNVTFSFRANQPATFQCQLDGGALAPCSSPFSAGPLALGMHTFTVQGTDIPGNHNSVSRSFTIAAAPPGGGAPSITNVTQSHRIWRRGASARASA